MKIASLRRALCVDIGTLFCCARVRCTQIAPQFIPTESSHGRSDRDGADRRQDHLQDLQASPSLVPQAQPRPLEAKGQAEQRRIEATPPAGRRSRSQSCPLAPAGRDRPARERAAPTRNGPTASRARPTGRGRLTKKGDALPSVIDDPLFGELPANHGYANGVVTLFLRLVQLGISLRAAGRVLEFVARSFGLPFSAPDWTTGRMWLLRFGLAQLLAAKGPADDWVWLMDHSVQIGKEKVLAILGIRLVDLPMPERPLRADDLVLIDLIPMERATREDVAACLEETAARTRVPCAIVDDHGVDLNGGVQIFQRSHPRTVEIYDVKHKGACLLKARLEKDPSWVAFSAELARTRCAIQQTELGPLTPPASKPKARFMNLGEQLDWADRVLRLLDRAPGEIPSWMTRDRLDAKLGWLRGFRGELAQWRQWQALVDQTVEVVG